MVCIYTCLNIHTHRAGIVCGWSVIYTSNKFVWARGLQYPLANLPSQELEMVDYHQWWPLKRLSHSIYSDLWVKAFTLIHHICLWTISISNILPQWSPNMRKINQHWFSLFKRYWFTENTLLLRPLLIGMFIDFKIVQLYFSKVYEN